MHVYIPLRPLPSGHPQGGGYQCGACNLKGLAYGEPHFRSSGGICEPEVSDLAASHPQKTFDGKGIHARASLAPGAGAVLERQNAAGDWEAQSLDFVPEDAVPPSGIVNVDVATEPPQNATYPENPNPSTSPSSVEPNDVSFTGADVAPSETIIEPAEQISEPV